MAKTIVWIEDDVDIIDPVIRPLERAGHRILRLRLVQEALENIELIRNSDLILLDIILPSGDVSKEYGRYSGLELLQELKDEHGIETPVVVLSVVTNAEVYRRLRELGVKDIIRKPILPSKLKERVERVLEELAE